MSRAKHIEPEESGVERAGSPVSGPGIRVDGRGRLIIDADHWPKVHEAQEALERYLYDHAMEASGGNAAAAGRLIGWSPYQMFVYGRRMRGEEPRKPKAAPSLDEAAPRRTSPARTGGPRRRPRPA